MTLKVEKQRMFGDNVGVAVLTHKKPALASRKKALPHKKVVVARGAVQFRKSQSAVGIRLNQAESVAVAGALIKPPAPNRALVDAFHAHKKSVAV
jgi:hypothetical protein